MTCACARDDKNRAAGGSRAATAVVSGANLPVFWNMSWVCLKMLG